jgi:hypothetical protein
MTIKIDLDDDGETDITITKDQVRRVSLIIKSIIGSAIAAAASLGCFILW